MYRLVRTLRWKAAGDLDGERIPLKAEKRHQRASSDGKVAAMPLNKLAASSPRFP